MCDPTSRKDAPGMVKNKFFVDLNPLFFEVKTLKQNTNFSLSCLKDIGIKFEKNTLYVLRVKKSENDVISRNIQRDSLQFPRGASFLLDGSQFSLWIYFDILK